MARAARRVRGAGVRRPAATLLDVFVRRTPHKPLLLFEDEVATYEQVERRSSQAARALRDAAGLWAGGCLALFMGSRAAYVWVWLGCAKLGCGAACFNPRVRTASLLRCLQSSAATVLLAAPELKESVEEILPFLKKENVYYLSKTSATEGVESFLDKVDASSDEPTPLSWRSDITLKTPALYIYTSGTTGNVNSQKLYGRPRIPPDIVGF